MKRYISTNSSLLTLLRRGGKIYINDWTCIRTTLFLGDIVCETERGDKHFELNKDGLKRALEYAQPSQNKFHGD